MYFMEAKQLFFWRLDYVLKGIVYTSIKIQKCTQESVHVSRLEVEEGNSKQKKIIGKEKGH